MVKMTMKDCDPTDMRSALSVLDKFNLALTLMLLAFGKEVCTIFPLYFITNCSRINAIRKIMTIAILSNGISTPNSINRSIAHRIPFFFYLLFTVGYKDIYKVKILFKFLNNGFRLNTFHTLFWVDNFTKTYPKSLANHYNFALRDFCIVNHNIQRITR